MVYLSEVKCLHRSRMIASAAARKGIRHKETSMNTGYGIFAATLDL